MENNIYGKLIENVDTVVSNISEPSQLRSKQNLAELKQLSAELSLDGIRLTINPFKATSPEAIIEDVLIILRDKKSGGQHSILEYTY